MNFERRCCCHSAWLFHLFSAPRIILTFAFGFCNSNNNQHGGILPRIHCCNAKTTVILLFDARNIMFFPPYYRNITKLQRILLEISAFVQLGECMCAMEICLNFSSLNTKAFCAQLKYQRTPWKAAFNTRAHYHTKTLPLVTRCCVFFFLSILFSHGFAIALSKKYILPRSTN